MQPAQKLLILKLSSFGDIIHCLPVLTNLKDSFPNWQIDWLISESFSDLLEDHNQINKLYKLPKRSFQWLQTLKFLKKQKYDYVLEMQGLIKTSLIAKFINPKKIIGVVPFREKIGQFLLTDKIYSDKSHIIERSAEVLKYFGLKNPDLNNFGFSNQQSKKTIICAPEARWKSKIWPHWPQFIQKLKKEFSEYEIILLGSKSDTIEENIIDLRGKTQLKDLPQIISQAELLIGSDSGLIHLASALHKKTLGIYGPTSPARTGPWNGNFVWLNTDCSPCHKRKCPLENENNLKCLKQISPNLALEKVKEILC